MPICADQNRGRRFIGVLPTDKEGTERADEFRRLIRDAATGEWEFDTAVQAYRLAGDGSWELDLHDAQMILTAAMEASPRLLATIEPEIERAIERCERLGS